MISLPRRKKIAIVCIITIFISSWIVYGLYRGFTLLLDQEEFKIRKDDISFDIPSWISDNGVERINDFIVFHGEVGLFDKNISQEIAFRYKQNHLFKRVIAVKRIFPNKINMSLELRKPLAEINSNNGNFLIDRDSIRISYDYYNWPINGEQTVYILVNKLKNTPLEGKKCKDKRIILATDLVRFLKKNNADKALEIETIDASNAGKKYTKDTSGIVMLTKSGTMIKWGHTGLEKETDEPSDEVKLKNLLSVASAARVADNDFAGLEYVDVRWAKPVGKEVEY